jgi:TPR repeat protein
MAAGDIPNARLVLQQAAEAGNATAALELGATYDPTIVQEQKARVGPTKDSVPAMTDMADIRMARLWYEKARDLGSTEAVVRLEKLRSVSAPRR